MIDLIISGHKKLGIVCSNRYEYSQFIDDLSVI